VTSVLETMSEGSFDASFLAVGAQIGKRAYGVCPDNAVIKLGERYEIDHDFCKGSGICAAECPCGAITMEPEEI
jgi:MinD superfamily P-loop ATPase